MKKKFNPRIKARLRKNRQVLSKNIDNFFGWVKGAKLVELKECNPEEDPVRPELDNKFRTGYGRKIFGVEYQGEIHAVMCFAYTNEIPKSVEELEKLSTDAFLQTAMRDQSGGQIAVAYTVWSKKKGGGKLIVKEVFKNIKKSNHLNRLVTLSPLTEMATNFHERNGETLIQINEQNKSIILISTDTDELLKLSDKISVIHKGKLSKIMNAEEVTSEKLGILMGGGN